MALCELDLKRIELDMAVFMVKRRPRPEIRSQVDLRYRVFNQSVVLFEVRPRWNDPHEIIEIPIAKATFVKTKGHWQIFWQRADLRWHRYDPLTHVRFFKDFLGEVDRDPYGCFFG